jgi:hypothetical protein
MVQLEVGHSMLTMRGSGCYLSTNRAGNDKQKRIEDRLLHLVWREKNGKGCKQGGTTRNEEAIRNQSGPKPTGVRQVLNGIQSR